VVATALKRLHPHVADWQPCAAEKGAKLVFHKFGRTQIGPVIVDQNFFALLGVVLPRQGKVVAKHFGADSLIETCVLKGKTGLTDSGCFLIGKHFHSF
jgi:hypothetical protein